jgi:hypothetical protein
MGIVQHSVGYGWIWISLTVWIGFLWTFHGYFAYRTSVVDCSLLRDCWWWTSCTVRQKRQSMLTELHPSEKQSPCWFQVSSMFIYCFCLPYLFICHMSYVTICLPGFTIYLPYFTYRISRMISPCWSSGLRDDFVHLHWDQCRKRPLLAPLRWGFWRSGWRAGGAYWDLLALLLGDYMDYIMNHFQIKDLHNIGNGIYLFLFFWGWLYT